VRTRFLGNIASPDMQASPINMVKAYLTDALQRIVSGRTKSHELHTLLPWNWRPPSTTAAT
jgi:transposase